MVTEAGMREEATCKSGETPSGYERASDEIHPRHSLLKRQGTPPRLGVYLDPATCVPVGAGFFGTTSSGFPGSVCTLQSKITYWRPTWVIRNAP